MTGLAGKGRGYWNAVNSAKLFSQLNPYFISVDSLTLFPDTELYRMEREEKFTPAGEKESMEELQVFINNLQIRTHLFAYSLRPDEGDYAPLFDGKEDFFMEDLKNGLEVQSTKEPEGNPSWRVQVEYTNHTANIFQIILDVKVDNIL